MNFIAHFVAATRMLPAAAPLPLYVMANALPDLLPLAAPRVRLRPAMLDAAPQQTSQEAAIRAGVKAHLRTDEIFHKTRAFAEAAGEVGGLVDRAGFADMRVRRFFLAHVLTELALDAHLIRQEPELLDTFYAACADTDYEHVKRWAEAATHRLLPDLPHTLTRFVHSQYLRHYATDGGVAEGFNRLCLRARQDTFTGPNAARLVTVTTKAAALMTKYAPALLAETAAALHPSSAASGDNPPQSGC